MFCFQLFGRSGAFAKRLGFDDVGFCEVDDIVVCGVSTERSSSCLSLSGVLLITGCCCCHCDLMNSSANRRAPFCTFWRISRGSSSPWANCITASFSSLYIFSLYVSAHKSALPSFCLSSAYFQKAAK